MFIVVLRVILIKNLKAHNSASLAVADGRPIFWALKLLGQKEVDHLPGYYLTEKICELSSKKI